MLMRAHEVSSAFGRRVHGPFSIVVDLLNDRSTFVINLPLRVALSALNPMRTGLTSSLRRAWKESA